MYEPWQMDFGLILRLGLIAGIAVGPWNSRGLHAAERFLAGIDDLPLMSGLSQLDGHETVFDSPTGRIIEVYAEGSVTREGVMSFYAATLPQLGWQARGPGVFLREGEVLRLEFPSRSVRRSSITLTVRFYLSPG